ncbi:RrF2 family transcriptional regulator [Balneatrix alpica]|uniref:RrF2 family transcriptional regulator n=1 Tax=Balneatrix alpica TaxID=75684 RepID=A0ABV5ZDA6_9GAMM|nr:Rrf2 family transcriptional regulator [Balneatrix alpica]
MQLSRFTDYSLRVLFYVGTHNDRLTTLAEIADFYQISLEHLRKVVHNLSKAGYLATYRGKNGGIRLARPAQEINIGDVILASEGRTPLVDCAKQDCCLTYSCSLQPVLAKAQEAFISTLRQYTLASLLSTPAMQQELIRLHPLEG